MSRAADIPVIAVDGPAASGKGTVAAGVAAELGFHLLDSGALYRLVAFAALQGAIPLDAEARLAAAAAALDVVFTAAGVRLAGQDVTAAIRSEAVGAGASRVAALRACRRRSQPLRRAGTGRATRRPIS